MALKIPNTLSNLIFADSQSASLVQQSLTTAVQPVLNFINQYFTTSGSGSNVLLTLNQALTLTKQLLVASGSLQSPGLAFKDNNALGLFYDNSNTSIGPRIGVTVNQTLVGYISAAGFNLQSPSSAGNAVTFYNAAGAALGNVNNAGTLTLPAMTATATPGFTSASGFKQSLHLGHVYVNSTTANGSQQTVETIVLVSGSGATARYCQRTMPFAGSALAIVADCTATIASQQTVNVYKNGTSIGGIFVAANAKGATGTIAKNAQPFVAGDAFTATVAYATAVSSTTTATMVTLFFEQAA